MLMWGRALCMAFPAWCDWLLGLPSAMCAEAVAAYAPLRYCFGVRPVWRLKNFVNTAWSENDIAATMSFMDSDESANRYLISATTAELTVAEAGLPVSSNTTRRGIGA